MALADIAYTVGDLRDLLQNFDDDTPIQVAAVPDSMGWTNFILACTHQDENGVVLALSEETADAEERSLRFVDEDGAEIRPV